MQPAQGSTGEGTGGLIGSRPGACLGALDFLFFFLSNQPSS